MSTLKIILCGAKYCPMCGKGIFKSYLTSTGSLFDDSDGIWKYKCKKCGWEFIVLTPNVELKKIQVKEKTLKIGDTK